MLKNENIKEEVERLKKEFYEGMKELKDSVRKVSDGYGRFVVGIVSPSAVKYFSEFGYNVIGTSFQKTIYKNGVSFAEYDVFIESILNGKMYIIVGEAKTNCSSDDVDDFIKRIKKLSKSEIYKDKIKIGFIGAVNYGEGADRYAIKQGLYVFKVSNEIMRLSVPKRFLPKEFY